MVQESEIQMLFEKKIQFKYAKFPKGILLK